MHQCLSAIHRLSLVWQRAERIAQDGVRICIVASSAQEATDLKTSCPVHLRHIVSCSALDKAPESLAISLLNAVTHDFDALHLLALLRHPLTTLRIDNLDEIEIKYLRGTRSYKSLSHLAQDVHELRSLSTAAQRFSEILKPRKFALRDCFDALRQCVACVSDVAISDPAVEEQEVDISRFASLLACPEVRPTNIAQIHIAFASEIPQCDVCFICTEEKDDTVENQSSVETFFIDSAAPQSQFSSVPTDMSVWRQLSQERFNAKPTERPTTFSVQDVRLLKEDPYLFYVHKALRIWQLPQLNQQFSRQTYQSAIKQVFASKSATADELLAHLKVFTQPSRSWRLKLDALVEWARQYARDPSRADVSMCVGDRYFVTATADDVLGKTFRVFSDPESARILSLALSGDDDATVEYVNLYTELGKATLVTETNRDELTNLLNFYSDPDQPYALTHFKGNSRASWGLGRSSTKFLNHARA